MSGLENMGVRRNAWQRSPAQPGRAQFVLAHTSSARSPPAASEPTEPTAEPAAAPAVAAAAEPADAKPETTFYEGSGAPAELVISLLLGATVLYLPLTLASIGRRLWIRYKFTNKRLIITTDSPVFKREVQVGVHHAHLHTAKLLATTGSGSRC